MDVVDEWLRKHVGKSDPGEKQEEHGPQAGMGRANSKNSKKPSSEILRNEVGDTSWTMGRIGDFILNMMGDYWNMWKREGKYMMRFVLKIVSAVI